MSHDFFTSARPHFITALLAAALYERSRDTAVDVIVGYCLWELQKRDLRLDKQTAKEIRVTYGSLDFSFHVHKRSGMVTVLPTQLLDSSSE